MSNFLLLRMDSFANGVICSNNMLYPKVDKDSRLLTFTCKQCPYVEIAVPGSGDNVVYQSDFQHAERCADVYSNNSVIFREKTTILQDVGADPTLPHTSNHACPKYVAILAWFYVVDVATLMPSSFRRLMEWSCSLCVAALLVVIDGRIVRLWHAK